MLTDELLGEADRKLSDSCGVRTVIVAVTRILFAFEWLRTITTLPSRSRRDIKGKALG